MAEKNNAKCSICGKDYYMCLSCKDTMSVHPWKMFCDTSVHYQVFQVVRGFNTGVYTKDEARTKLKNIDLSDLNTFRPHIKSIIEDILKESKVEKLVEEKPVVSRKRDIKVNKVEVEEKVEDEIIETE